MSIIVFIPVRGGSKSIPNKNILKIFGKPLVQYSIEACIYSELVDRVIVASDSDDILNTVNSLNLPKLETYRRLSINAQDTSSTESVVLEYFNSKDFDLLDSDTFILMQATTPQCRTRDIDGALALFSTNRYDSILSGVKFERFIWDSSGKALNYDYNSRPRRQDILTNYYIENGAFYISFISDFKLNGNRLNGNIGIYEMDSDSLIELDEPQDIPLIEKIISQRMSEYFFDVNNIKLVLSDIDGTLTDSGMYYTESGEAMKKFNTRDGHGFKILKDNDILCGVITSEVSLITRSRFLEKLKLDFIVEGVSGLDKLIAVQKICHDNGFSLNNVAYIGDDVNCRDLLNAVGVKFCPNDAHKIIKDIRQIVIAKNNGGNGCFRELVDFIIDNNSK
jgi:YrbI family 3-deoxy-D-manno-octulosonate 8-phosphate phosphatase